MTKGQELYKKAKTLIPGGTQLLSKRPEMHLPDLWPSYYDHAKRCTITDLDGNTYEDLSYMGIGANVLGYCDEDVDGAVGQTIKKGNYTTLNSPLEVELAELMLQIHPWADMVRYAKSGGECIAIAIRIARAVTGKDIILFCGYHGWHDWYLAANLQTEDALGGVHLAGLEPSGVPKGLRGTSYPFSYNDKETFKRLIAEHDGRIAAVIIEPLRSEYPADGFLEEIRKVTKEKDIVLIVDEVTMGNKLCGGGAHLTLGIEPDMATFAKAISNGYPQGIVIGKREVMEAAQTSFISSSSWTEAIGLAASIAAIHKFKDKQIEKHLDKAGRKVMKGWEEAAKSSNLKIHTGGLSLAGHFAFVYEDPMALKTYFTQEMLAKGFLATTACYMSYAHTEEVIERYLEAVNEVFEKISRILQAGEDIKARLQGGVCHAGFQRLAR